MAQETLPLQSVIGFGGSVVGGLQLHPDGEHLIYPLGSTVIIKNKSVESEDESAQTFLQGHTDKVSCIALSKSGKYIASGQVTYMGFAADICIWDFEKRELVHRMSLHKVKVQALCFSEDDRFLASLGGQDDNSLVVWDVLSGTAVCGSPTHNDNTLTVKFFNLSPYKLLTGGKYNLTIWEFDKDNRKIKPSEVQLGQMKRLCNTMVIDGDDEFAYVGTASGDLLQVSLEQRLFKNHGPTKPIALGIIVATMSPDGSIICGGGDGTVAILNTPDCNSGAGKSSKTIKTKTQTTLDSSVTSVVLADTYANGDYTFYVGTKHASIYMVRFDAATQKLHAELITTCHYNEIKDVAFPDGYSEVFATCGTNNIRIWHLRQCRELLRIQVPNLVCNCVAFMADGKSIISGWSDGKIRAFYPQSGKLMYCINDAHIQGVTAIIGSGDCTRIISGGNEGMVRVWRIGSQSQSMIASMKEHKGSVNCIQLRKNDSECVSGWNDGSCIIWNLTRFTRNNSLFASTFFKAIVYHPDESQLVTTGTDRKITYWDAYDGQAIRILDGSEDKEINSLDVSHDGDVIVSGAGDKLVKLWGYDEGLCYYVGTGHSGSITKVKVSPDMQYIISSGSEGAIFIWKYMPLPRDGDE